MKILEITIPYPVSVNNLYFAKKFGGKYLNHHVPRYRQTVFALCAQKQKFGDSKIRLEIKMYPPDRRIRDIDNICKVILDSLQCSGVYNNDSQVYQLYVEKLEVRKYGEIELKIMEIESE